MTVYKVKLTRIESNHTNLRTDSVEGFTLQLPIKGSGLRVVGDSLTPGMSARVVNTSEIQSVDIKSDKEFDFTTLNSSYKLEVLGVEEIE